MPLFHDWPASALQRLCKVIGHRRFQKGDVVLVEGETRPRWLPVTDDAESGPLVFIVQSGAPLEVSSCVPPLVLACAPGEHFPWQLFLSLSLSLSLSCLGLLRTPRCSALDWAGLVGMIRHLAGVRGVGGGGGGGGGRRRGGAAAGTPTEVVRLGPGHQFSTIWRTVRRPEPNSHPPAKPRGFARADAG